jgi:hypothetical protein
MSEKGFAARLDRTLKDFGLLLEEEPELIENEEEEEGNPEKPKAAAGTAAQKGD